MCFLPAALLLLAWPATAGEPDWFSRVKRDGIEKASRVEVERHEKGMLQDSLHVGECYYVIGMYEEGIAVFRRLLRSPDRNYAAAAMQRLGEGYFHTGRQKEAKETFTRCLEEHPEAWLDESIPELCRAWLRKLEGKLVTPEPAGEKPPATEELRKEMKELEQRLAELKAMLEKLAEEH
jgi:tetratricopeptide (TPR) repeat protein